MVSVSIAISAGDVVSHPLWGVVISPWFDNTGVCAGRTCLPTSSLIIRQEAIVEPSRIELCAASTLTISSATTAPPPLDILAKPARVLAFEVRIPRPSLLTQFCHVPQAHI